MEEFSHFFQVRLDLFDGPIDLLLHLVKGRELPIEKVSLAAVAEQYLACIESVHDFDLEIAGEYLVIAATLLSIKSSVLLGEPATLVEDADGNLIDPHEELLRRLREAAIYKEGAQYLGSLSYLGIDVFPNLALLKEIDPVDPGYAEHDPFLLGRAFRKLLANAGPGSSLQIAYDPVSIVERMMGVMNALRAEGGTMQFHRLVPDLTNRASIISTFIALLELCKRQIIKVEQLENSDEIAVGLASPDAQASDLSSEFDEVTGKSAIANG